MTARIALAGIAALLLATSAHADDKANLKGNWSLVSADRAGTPAPPDAVKMFKVIIADDKFTIREGKDDFDATFKLDEKASPKQADMTPTTGPKKGKTLLCIYELTGDDLRICFSDPGKERPKDLKKAGPDQTLFVLKRDK